MVDIGLDSVVAIETSEDLRLVVTHGAAGHRYPGYSMVKTAEVTSFTPFGGAWQSNFGIEPRQ